MKYMGRKIKDIPEHLRPREKLVRNGASSLSDEELLALILGSGTKGRDVVSLAKDIISLGWDRLRAMSVKELTERKGIGQVKAVQIKALLELVDRIGNPFRDVYINSPSDAYEFLKDKFDRRKESLLALYLDVSHRVLGFEVVVIGRVNAVYASPKDILYEALKKDAYGILIAHNHPSGSSEPSVEDLRFTQRLKEACLMLGFELIDHLVIGEEDFLSLRQIGEI